MTMKRALFVAIAAMAINAHAEKRKPEVFYAGQGRYVCSSNSAACAQVDSNNRIQSDRDSQRYQRDQDHAQAVVDRERRKDDDRRNEQRKYP